MRRPAVSIRSSVATAALAMAVLLGGARIGGAHVEADPNVSVVLAELPHALVDVRVEVRRTIGVQIAIENRGARTVEVLDEAGVPFLRIGPHGSEGNVAARAWYETYTPLRAAAAPAGGGPPRWRRVSDEPAFGWFDPRLDDSRVEVPPAVRRAGRPTYFRSWEIPLRVDGAPVSVRGWFRFEPRPAGAYRARLTSPARPADGVRVTLLPGRVPGLLLENRSDRAVVVLGADGEPFLRIGAAGVEANRRSPTWQQSARSSGAELRLVASAAEPDWQRVSTAPRYGWIEPRAVYRHQLPAAALAGRGEVEVLTWEVPVLLEEQILRITGVLSWKPG